MSQISRDNHPPIVLARASGIARVLLATAAILLAAIGTTPVAIAASCNGSHHQMFLTAGKASPGSGTTSTTFTFTVRYTDNRGCAPTFIRVEIPGRPSLAMTTTGTDYAGGVTYRASTTLPAGSWTYRFSAASGDGPGYLTFLLTTVSPSKVIVLGPTPTPSPKPTPEPTPQPTPRPTPKPTGTPKPTASSGSSTHGTPKPSRSPANGSGGNPSPTGGPAGAPGLGYIDDGGSFGGDSDPSDLTGSGGIDLSNVGGFAPIAAWVSATLLGLAVFAWVLRRPERDLASPLAGALSMAAQARGLGRTANREPVEPDHGVDQPAADAVSASVEVVETAPLAAAPRLTGWQTRPPLTFASGADRDVVRRNITYRLVRVSDAPDDLRSRELFRLDRGDEVEILGQESGFLQVRTPTGIVGWIRSASVIG